MNKQKPDYAPIEIDPNVVETDKSGGKLETSQGGGAVLCGKWGCGILSSGWENCFSGWKRWAFEFQCSACHKGNVCGFRKYSALSHF